MYNGKYVPQLSIEEVIVYYDKLRTFNPAEMTKEEIEDYNICKERLIAYAYDILNKKNN